MSAKADISNLDVEEMDAQSDVRPIPTFQEIFRAHAPYVWRTLRRLGVADADAADMCQEVFVVVHRRLADFDGSAAIKTWVYGIAIRVAAQYRRKASRRHEELADEPPELSLDPAQEGAFRRRELLDRLSAALEKLDEQKREVFVLYELEELTMSEVAEVLGCPLQTAYSRLHAARALVRASFGAKEPNE